ncbi:YhgE/Pip domain-containing protein [Ferdinandcohnia quinoae]|uniref:YhgE/Pip domain-containing protein n=1 Tax=Fredinandcohnia quinoae TaxID=2918902 RepID=A0AAW5E4G7_9BACI|nr:YhgE/Pip domain-containing protein [Fredinandcohnia sp. SECRCQ15]MCH1624236.1 YhgE/Pip domain-containing protein [Fredinandcohnia sp. SECRCQ15]
MKNIFQIYKTDVKRIVTNWAALIIILGLIFLPSLYAWFNIKASWDPYGNTKGIKIAVTNHDEGTTIKEKKINAGEEIVESLKKNKLLGWTFVDEKTALNGVNHGNYYASIIIPKDFSAKIATVLTKNPTKATIDYTVNEKINAIAPKITAKGATGITEQISKNFIKTANGAIFKIFNEIGVELEKELPTIQKVRDLIFKLEKNFPALKNAVNTALTDANKTEDIVNEVQKNLPIVAHMTQEGIRVSDSLQQYLKTSKDIANTIAPNVKQDIQTLTAASLYVEQVTASMQNGTISIQDAKAQLGHIEKQLGIGITVTNVIIDLFDHVNNLTNSEILTSEISKLQGLTNKYQKEQELINRIQEVDEEQAKGFINEINRLAKETTAITEDLTNRYESDIKPKLEQGFQKAQLTAENADRILNETNQRIPEVEGILKDAQQGLSIGKAEISHIQASLPTVESKIKELADSIRKFEKEQDLNEIIQLLTLNFQKESEFFAEPVELKEHHLFPIPNYGSAMSPFFTTLSLWVGALLLVSLLTVEVHSEEIHFKSYEIYFGRFLTFWTIAILQSLIVTVGDMAVLGTYVDAKPWFVLFGAIISTVFMCIVYTLVSIFGNVGKAMAIVFLVLQLAGSGGTFPIQVTPPFFQAIFPFLPFTYAISMMREAVGGILWDVVRHDLLVLSLFTGITLLFGLALKKPINNISGGLVKKAKASKLIH